MEGRDWPILGRSWWLDIYGQVGLVVIYSITSMEKKVVFLKICSLWSMVSVKHECWDCV